MASDFAQRAYQYYLSQGLPPHQAAALAGHAEWESSGRTRVEHDSGTGVGLMGWRDPDKGVGRKTALLEWAKSQNRDPYDEKTQLDFALHEMRTSEKAAGDAFFGSKDLTAANRAMMAFLRPAGYTADNPTAGHGYQGRYQNSAELVGLPPGSAVAAAPAAPGLPPGLLAGTPPTPPVDPAIAAAKEKERAQEMAYGSLLQQGQQMMAEAEPKAAPLPAAPMGGGLLQGSSPTPLFDFTKPQPTFPDFIEMLSQQRLRRT